MRIENIIQSFWSKPLLESNKDIYQNRLNGGWINYRYNLLSMAYSCLTIAKHYPSISMFTDRYGLSLFRDSLNLPYKDFYDELSSIKVDESLWAYGKIHTYSIQKEPFIHIDNDIFIWDRLPLNIENAQLACQNIELIDEVTTNDYIIALNYIRKNMIHTPKVIKDSLMKTSVNMGIFGGNDLEFISRYSMEAKKFVHNSYRDILNSGKHKGLFNIIFEQLLFSEMSKIEEKPITFLLSPTKNSDLSPFFGIETSQYDLKFSHCLGALKQSSFICEQIEYRMKYEFPDHYEIILDYLNRKGLHYQVNSESMKNYDNFIKTYSVLRHTSRICDILSNFKFKIKDGYHIQLSGGEYTLIGPNSSEHLKGWGKFLVLFSTPLRGDDICKYINTEKLLPGITYEQVQNAIFNLIIQGLYIEKCIELA